MGPQSPDGGHPRARPTVSSCPAPRPAPPRPGFGSYIRYYYYVHYVCLVYHTLATAQVGPRRMGPPVGSPFRRENPRPAYRPGNAPPETGRRAAAGARETPPRHPAGPPSAATFPGLLDSRVRDQVALSRVAIRGTPATFRVTVSARPGLMAERSLAGRRHPPDQKGWRGIMLATRNEITIPRT